MGLLDKLGIKKASSRQKDEKTRIEKKEALPEKPKETTKTRSVKSSRAHEILLKPILSEKATHMATLGKYIFAVSPRANKTEIAKSIASVYSVNVVSVKIVKMPGKMRRYGRSVGRTSDWKKAIVTLKPGEKIAGIIEAVG
ncbi:MAG: 50S ribosomal protein L23 [bacterium]|nr:50S ribosomal protein L23 [bacterium]